MSMGCVGVAICYDDIIMELRPNNPLNTHVIARLIDDPDDMRRVWPKARWPFDHGQWCKALDPASGHHPFLIYEDDQAIGHVALRVTAAESVYSINYLYLKPSLRNHGQGQAVMVLVEKYAVERLKAHQLNLVVRTHNPRAMACYEKCGFKAKRQDGNLVSMEKVLLP